MGCMFYALLVVKAGYVNTVMFKGCAYIQYIAYIINADCSAVTALMYTS